MPQLKLKLTLDKRLTLGKQRRRYKKILKRYERKLKLQQERKEET